MNSITGKKLVIYGLVGGAAILLSFIFFWYRRTIPQQVPTPEEKRVSGRLPRIIEGQPAGEELPKEEVTPEIIGTSEQKLLQLTDFPIISPSLNPKEDRLLFYKKGGGDLLSYDFSGKEPQKIANITIVGILEALWSPAKDRAAVFYLDGETLKAFLHIGTSSVAVLPQNIESFSWSPNGSSLAYLRRENEKASLITADAGGMNQRNIAEFPLWEARLQWSANDRISVSTAPSGLAEGFLFLFSRGSGTLTKIARGFGLEALWSPNGSLILISSTASGGKNIRLSLLDAGGKELWSPGMATIVDKCVFASADKIYCAIPRFISPGGVLPDDYLRGSLHTADRIVALDTDKKEIREVFTEGTFDISDLIITSNEEYLFFVDRRDGTLWRYKLK